MPHHASCRRAHRWIEAKLSEGDETNDGLIFAISGGDHDHCMCSAVAVHCWRSLRPRHSARHLHGPEVGGPAKACPVGRPARSRRA